MAKSRAPPAIERLTAIEIIWSKQVYSLLSPGRRHFTTSPRGNEAPGTSTARRHDDEDPGRPPCCRARAGGARGWAACSGDRRGLAGPHVDWLDDGTVLLKLGPAYDDAIIETSAATSWAACSGRTSSPSRGTTITILTHDEGPQGADLRADRGASPGLGGADRRQARARAGADRRALRRADARPAARAPGGYDAIVVAAYFYGDLIAGDYLAPVDG